MLTDEHCGPTIIAHFQDAAKLAFRKGEDARLEAAGVYGNEFPLGRGAYVSFDRDEEDGLIDDDAAGCPFQLGAVITNKVVGVKQRQFRYCKLSNHVAYANVYSTPLPHSKTMHQKDYSIALSLRNEKRSDPL